LYTYFIFRLRVFFSTKFDHTSELHYL
jgi:hypothetical protein